MDAKNNNDKQLVIIGAGGHAKEVVWLARVCGWNIIGVLDDSAGQDAVAGVRVLGEVSLCTEYDECFFTIAVGDPRSRSQVANKLEVCLPQVRYATLIHPSVVLSESVSIGEGSVIAAGSVVSADVKIGKQCILNINSSLSHEVVIADYCTIAPNAALAGNVTVEGLVEIGLGASVRQGLNLGAGSLLGMGAVLVRNLPSGVVYVGNPAIYLKDI